MCWCPTRWGVNVGDYADKVRGAPPASKKITGATKANPVVITAAAHGFANNDIVYITGVKGMTQLNDKPYTVKNKTANTFELYQSSVRRPSKHPKNNATKINGSNYSTYTSAGDAYCAKDRCEYRHVLQCSKPERISKVICFTKKHVRGRAHGIGRLYRYCAERHYRPCGNQLSVGSVGGCGCPTNKIQPCLTTDKDLSLETD